MGNHEPIREVIIPTFTCVKKVGADGSRLQFCIGPTVSQSSSFFQIYYTEE